MANLHSRLKQLRKKHGLSQHQLAEMCQVTQPTIANWERGDNIPRQQALQRLADSLSVESSWLLSGENPAASNPAHQHLSKPIRNIPIYDWVDTHEEFSAARPSGYITMSVEGDSLFAMSAPNGTDFQTGTVLIFDRHANTSGPVLTECDGQISLEQAAPDQTDKTLGRLVYSMQPH